MSSRENGVRTREAGAPRISLARAAALLAIVPLCLILWDTATGGLGVEPVEALRRRTGWWSLTLLVATLAVTPVRRLSGWNKIIQIRRPLGVAAFVYAALHFVVYIAIDQGFAFSYIIEDIVERPYITAGFIALLMLTPLAATSTRNAVRRMGGKRWQRLHRLIYPAALLGVLHYYWLVKADTTRPLIFAGIVTVLLLLRIKMLRGKGQSRARPVPVGGASVRASSQANDPATPARHPARGKRASTPS